MSLYPLPNHHQPEIEAKPCEECGGDGLGEPCSDCSMGQIPEECSTCDDTGFLPCEDCHGTGIRDEEKAEQNAIDERNEYNPEDGLFGFAVDLARTEWGK